MSSDIALAFTELFVGSGAWLGLLLFMAIVVTLSLKEKYVGVLMIPVCIFLGINYLSYPSLMWHAIIMFFTAVFIMIKLATSKGKS